MLYSLFINFLLRIKKFLIFILSSSCSLEKLKGVIIPNLNLSTIGKIKRLELKNSNESRKVNRLRISSSHRRCLYYSTYGSVGFRI